jgi:hypothetical protein
MVSALVEDLPAATVEFFRRRARRTGAASVSEHVRHELITLARGREPVDQVVEFVRDHHPEPPRPVVDADALALADAYALPEDVWDVLCRRAAASHVPVSDYVHGELVSISRHGTVDDVMWEMGEVSDADPSLDVDLDAVHAAVRYARGLD